MYLSIKIRSFSREENSDSGAADGKVEKVEPVGDGHRMSFFHVAKLVFPGEISHPRMVY
jgi:hypothetical protein